MSPIERLQHDVAAALTADAYFADVPVFVFRPRIVTDPNDGQGRAVGTVITAPEIEGAINAALSGLTTKADKSGAAVTVLMPVIECERPNVKGPATRAVVSVLCEEQTLANMDATTGTRKSAEDIATRAARLLHLRVFAPLGTLAAERDAMKPSLDPESGKVTYEVRLGCDLNNTPLTKCATPAITNSGTTVTITDATSGASIYYSTDDSMPAHGGTIGGAGASGSTLYSAPFTAAVGSNIRACAYKSGLAGSDAAQLTTA